MTSARAATTDHRREIYDVVIVGARCAGAPLAMLLARAGLKVLLIDKSKMPSDVLSTHLIWPPGGALLKQWGLLDRVIKAGAACCRRSVAQIEDIVVDGPWPTVNGVDFAISLRRIKLDAILLDAAESAGTHIRTKTRAVGRDFDNEDIDELIFEEDGARTRHRVRARLFVGADGRRSWLGRMVGAEVYDWTPSMTGSFYTYVAGLSIDRNTASLVREPPFEFVMVPADEDLVLLNLVVANRALADFLTAPKDNFFTLFHSLPAVSDAIAKAERVGPLRGIADLPSFFRRSCGRGWALLGDAGHHCDPIRALGIHHAFQDAEHLARLLIDAFSGRLPLGFALQLHEIDRDQRDYLPHKISIDAARFDRLAEPSRRLIETINGNSDAVAEMRGITAGCVDPRMFFEKWAPEMRARSSSADTAQHAPHRQPELLS